MATNWVTPEGAHIVKVLQRAVMSKANENTGSDLQPNQTFDPELENRCGEQVRFAVAEFRAAINKGGQFPISVTVGTVAPEHEAHALNLAAYRVIVSTPNLGMFLLTDKGMSSPFAMFYKEAQDELKRLREGESFTLPTDPTGSDYATALDATTNPAVNTVRYGGILGNPEQDLTTEDFVPDTV